MSERALALATRFEGVNNDLIAAVEGCTDDQWRATCAGEGWSVAVAAHHVALAYSGFTGMVRQVANGEPLPELTTEMLDDWNAKHAEEFANVSREETIAMLRSAGATAAGRVRGFSDEQLDRTATMPIAGGQPFSAAQFIERGLIGHPLGHGASIKAALGAWARCGSDEEEMNDQRDDAVIPSSGNVFADLGLPDPEDRLARAELASQIGAIVSDRALTQAAAADTLGVDQPKVSALLAGRLAGFSLERLAHFLTLFGKDVEIVVRDTPTPRTVGRFTVLAS